MKAWKIVGITVIVVVVLTVGAFALELGGLQWQRFFGPKHEDVRRGVFVATKSYNEGKKQELVKYRHEYLLAESEDERAIIASTVRMSFAEYDLEKLSSEQRSFVNKMNTYRKGTK